MMRNTDVVELDDVECLKETTSAILVRYMEEDLWVPKSVVDDDSEVYAAGDHGVLLVKEWWASKEGIE